MDELRIDLESTRRRDKLGFNPMAWCSKAHECLGESQDEVLAVTQIFMWDQYMAMSRMIEDTYL